jgi:hypothetical protein
VIEDVLPIRFGIVRPPGSNPGPRPKSEFERLLTTRADVGVQVVTQAQVPRGQRHDRLTTLGPDQLCRWRARKGRRNDAGR